MSPDHPPSGSTWTCTTSFPGQSRAVIAHGRHNVDSGAREAVTGALSVSRVFSGEMPFKRRMDDLAGLAMIPDLCENRLRLFDAATPWAEAASK